jgi:nucleolar protein 14
MLFQGRIDGQTVQKSHFGGFDEDEDDNEGQPERKKSKAEVMSEVIAKSKEYKVFLLRAEFSSTSC